MQDVPKGTWITGLVGLGVIVLLTIIAFVSFRYAKGRPSTIVLPAGNTYLGPSPSPILQTDRINVNPSDEMLTQEGKIFPFSFSYPKSLSLGVFPGDRFDSVTIFWGNTDPQGNLLLRVENLKEIPFANDYLNKPKIEYVKNWWKQYSWTGVDTISQFTNSKGLSGFRAKYKDTSGKSPYDNVFLEVPNRPELLVWLSGKLLDQASFDKIVDSVGWNRSK